MNDSYPSTLSVLQHADSMFPSGAVSFSWGLEALCNRSIIVESNRLFEFISAHLLSRWSCLDRPIIAHAHAAGNNTSILTKLDRNLEAQSLSTEQRLGSTQMGGALLSVHARTGTPGASNYIDLIARQQAFGHIPVIQGLIWHGLGFSKKQALMMSAHGLCTGILGAAIRLSIIGHINAQVIHTRIVPVIEEVLLLPIPAPEDVHSFIPQIEIASMNHENDEIRLFIN